MLSQLVLSLFPGVGLLDSAFELEGFCVARGPDYLWGGDVRKFTAPEGRFDGIIGGPPCQVFSSLAHMVRANGHQTKFGNLIPEYERIVSEAKPAWFLMENVRDAPTPKVEGYATWSTLLNNRQCIDLETGEAATQNRLRRWTFGVRGAVPHALAIETAALENPRFDYAATSAGVRQVPVACRAGGKPKKNRVGRNPERDFLSMRGGRGAAGFEAVKALQGVSPEFDLPPFRVEEKVKAIGNGVPIPMGRALANAVKEFVNQQVSGTEDC